MVDFHRFSIVCFHGHVILQVKSHHTANEHQDPKAHESRTWQLHAENHGDFSATWRFHKPRIWIKTPKPYPSKVKMVLNASKWINSSIGIHIQLKDALQSTSWGFRVTSPKSVLIPLGFSKVPNFVRPSTGLELWSMARCLCFKSHQKWSTSWLVLHTLQKNKQD